MYLVILASPIALFSPWLSRASILEFISGKGEATDFSKDMGRSMALPDLVFVTVQFPYPTTTYLARTVVSL